jgi:hypothetical protein
MDVIGVLGTVGTFGFGILSLYQWTALKALRKAIRGHAQTAFNNYRNIGSDTSFITSAILENPEKLDSHMIIGRCRAADATSVAGRHEVLSFAREYSSFVPFSEKAWEPKDQLLEHRTELKKVFSTLSGN